MKTLKSFLQNEDLRQWFSKTHPKGDWKRINSKGEVVGPCAREPGEAKPKCMSKEKRASLSKKERAAAVKAKRKHDPNPERKGAPINVSSYGKGKLSEDMEHLDEKNKPTNPKLWSRAVSLARSKFDVYPSAYANGWASKWYKSKGGGWRSVKEEREPMKSFRQFVTEVNDKKDTITLNIPLMIRMLELAREDVKDDMELHAITERLIEIRNKKDPEGGLNRKGIASYRRANPGSKLSMAVTTKPSKLKKGSKAWNRRKSFCSRMSGMKRRLTSAKTARDPNSRINKSLRKWNC